MPSRTTDVPLAVEGVDGLWQTGLGVIVVILLMSSLALGSRMVLARRGLGLLFTLPAVFVVSLLDPSTFSGVESVDILSWLGQMFNDVGECASVSLSGSPNAVVGDLVHHTARLAEMVAIVAIVLKALFAVGLFFYAAVFVYRTLTMLVSCMEIAAREFLVTLPACQVAVSGSLRRLRQSLQVVAFNTFKVVGDWVFTQIFDFLRLYTSIWFTVIVFFWLKEEEKLNLISQIYVLDKLYKAYRLVRQVSKGGWYERIRKDWLSPFVVVAPIAAPRDATTRSRPLSSV
ncbi:hypothetical protein V5O48_018638 [Marasmius crinis-equi]|uniref:Uncharacterized protein n=1 Tax=Marasmius crinis-equi TaxID=585013 RepID=A0ABR3EKP7_9AGAR